MTAPGRAANVSILSTRSRGRTLARMHHSPGACRGRKCGSCPSVTNDFQPNHPMNHILRLMIASVLLLSTQLRAQSAAPVPNPGSDVAPEHDETAPRKDRGQMRRLDRAPREMETVT